MVTCGNKTGVMDVAKLARGKSNPAHCGLSVLHNPCKRSKHAFLLLFCLYPLLFPKSVAVCVQLKSVSSLRAAGSLHVPSRNSGAKALLKNGNRAFFTKINLCIFG